eukprot:7276522-Alexandrium_andersonii.AAC.1
MVSDIQEVSGRWACSRVQLCKEEISPTSPDLRPTSPGKFMAWPVGMDSDDWSDRLGWGERRRAGW